MELLLQKNKCSIFHNIFEYMIFQRRQKKLLWSKGLNIQYIPLLSIFNKVSDILIPNIWNMGVPYDGIRK